MHDPYFGIELTQEQRESISKINETKDSIASLLKEVSEEFPRQVPEYTKRPNFGHGACRVLSQFDMNNQLQAEEKLSGQIDLPNIQYKALYRQAVKLPHGDEVGLFVASVPLDFSGKVNPGQTVPSEAWIPKGSSEESIRELARESFKALQKLVVDYYNAGPAAGQDAPATIQ